MSRKQEIVEAAAKLFAEKGYHATSITDLCNEVGLGRGALYYHIGSKEDLLWCAHNDHADPLIAYAQDVVSKPVSATEKLRLCGEELLRIIEKYRAHLIVFYREMHMLKGDRWDLIKHKRRQFEELLQAIIQEGIDSGEFRPVDPRIAVLGWLGMHIWAYQWFQSGGRRSPEEVARIFAQMVVGGLAADRDSVHLPAEAENS